MKKCEFVELYIGIDEEIPVWVFYRRLNWKSKEFILRRNIDESSKVRKKNKKNKK